jgi:hypothetical protein
MRLGKRLGPLLGSLLAVLSLSAPAAQAAGAPEVTATWVTTVTPNSVNLRGEVDPGGKSTTYRFEYTTAVDFAADGFVGASRAPLGGEPGIAAGEAPVPVVQHVGGLTAVTEYRYRMVAANADGTAFGPTRIFRTDESAPVFALPDSRAWELVSPLDENGGGIAAPEALFGGGVLQAAALGGAVTYGSAYSFGPSQGAPGASQYISRRSSGGWSTENVTLPLVSGGYPTGPNSGVPYQLFSSDLSAALISNGRRCRGEATDCPVANPALPGSGAPAGYRNYYRRDNAVGAFTALLDSTDLTGLEPQAFDLAFAGASDDLGQVVLSSCSALTPDAAEVPGPGGECDPAAQNLYLATAAGPVLINRLPGDLQGTLGATLAAEGGAGALSPARAYFYLGGNLYLREGDVTKQLDEGLGGGGTFEAAAADGEVAFLSKAGHLYRYLAAGGALTDLTPGGGLQGVLGASTDGSHVYYLTTSGLFHWNLGATSEVAATADASNLPPAIGTARVSDDGDRLAFLSSAQLGEYENAGQTEIYVYSAAADTLFCVSCNPSGERPLGPSTIPGAVANGDAIRVYKPRALSADGQRLFFDSADALVPRDTNGEPDVYEWELAGAGGCTAATGCLSLISSGNSSEGATFVDASASGGDAFFLTNGSLAPGDEGAVDLYDARVGGGFPVQELPIPCIGDACQQVPGRAEDPALATAVPRAEGNPPLRFGKAKKKKRKHRKPHRKQDHRKGHGGRR